MFDMTKRREEGFTLIELLIVIVIIGILAAVVVFAVSGIADRGQSSACSADLSSLRTASETMRASPTALYGNEFALKANGYVATHSTLYNVSAGASQAAADSATNYVTSSVTGAFYSIKYQSAECAAAASPPAAVGDVVP